jgi:hypothetical protein
MHRHYFLTTVLLVGSNSLMAQTSAEDSLGSTSKKAATYIGGYGNAFFQHNSDAGESEINLQRAVFFIGHKFNDNFSFFSELEIEDAKVSGGEEGGEVALEQCYLKMNSGRNSYFTGGLFLPRIGIINENHLPNSFNGNERPLVETYIIPSTWRELGVGYYTKLNSIPLNLSFALVNGLNSAAFEHGEVIRGGRYEGREASASCLAFTGAAQYKKKNFTFQLSGYMGGSAGVSKEESDSLNLDGGTFGTPVVLGEADIQYSRNGLSVRILGTIVNISDAYQINHAYNNDTPESAYGFYGEVGYDVLYSTTKSKSRSLILFARYENMDMNSGIPANTYKDLSLKQQHIVAGVTYLPIPQIALKGDVRMSSSEMNGDSNTFVNLGMGFSF